MLKLNQRTEGMEFIVCNSFSSSFDYFLALEICISNMIQAVHMPVMHLMFYFSNSTVKK